MYQETLPPRAPSPLSLLVSSLLSADSAVKRLLDTPNHPEKVGKPGYGIGCDTMIDNDFVLVCGGRLRWPWGAR